MAAREETATSTIFMGRFVLRGAGSFLVAAAAGLAFTLMVVVVRWEWAPVRMLDRWASDSTNRIMAGNEVLVAVLRTVTRLGDTTTLTFVVALGVLWLAARRHTQLAVFVALITAGGGALGVAVKQLVGRVRPLVDVVVDTAPGPAFPSGHALGATTCYGLLLLVFMPALRSWVMPALLVLVVTVVLLVGLSRVALGVHHLTDVVGGWLLGLLWLALTTEVFHRWRRETGVPTAPASRGLVPEAADDLRPVPRRGGVAVPRPWRTTAELLVGWGLLFGALYTLGRWLTAAGPDAAPGWDRAVVQWFAERRAPQWDALLEPFGTLVGTGPVIAAGTVVGVLGLAVARSWRPALLVALALLGEVTLFLASTAVVDRERPAVRIAAELPPTSAFPSGHVAATLVLGMAVTILVLRGTDRWWRWPVVAMALALPALVTVQRLYTGVHYPTDVLGSVLLALGWIAVVTHALDHRSGQRTTNSGANPSEVQSAGLSAR